MIAGKYSWSDRGGDIAAARGGLVDVADIEQMMGGGSHIPDLGDDIGAETLLDIQVIAIGIRQGGSSNLPKTG